MKIFYIIPIVFLIFCPQSKSLSPNPQDVMLFNGAYSGDVETVKTALNQGANVNAMDERPFFSGFTALMIACQNGHIEVVEFLLTREGIDVNLAYPSYSDLELEAWLAFLTEKNIDDINLTYPAHKVFQLTALKMAIIFSREKEIIKLLLAHKDINANKAYYDRFTYTPLMLAIAYSTEEIVKLLLAHKDIALSEFISVGGIDSLPGSQRSRKSENREKSIPQYYTALTIAIQLNKKEFVRLLLEEFKKAPLEYYLGHLKYNLLGYINSYDYAVMLYNKGLVDEEIIKMLQDAKNEIVKLQKKLNK